MMKGKKEVSLQKHCYLFPFLLFKFYTFKVCEILFILVYLPGFIFNVVCYNNICTAFIIYVWIYI